jgi:hypothetical protein
MLPGFRFLFAAIMLSMSLLVFGLGAAALLRAAHESFASNSSWRAAPEVPFAQHPDTTMPVLATLRVEPPAMEKLNDEVTIVAAPARAEPAAEPIRNDQVAALKPAETLPAEPVKPAEPAPPIPAAENPPAIETAPSPAASAPAASSAAEASVAGDERKLTIASVSETSSIKSESEPAAVQAELVTPPQSNLAGTTSETMAAPATTPADSLATVKIATLGGPPVDVSDDASALDIRSVKLPRARPDTSAINKRVQARRALHRRRLAARARLLALQQLQANPFGQPQTFPTAAPRQ